MSSQLDGLVGPVGRWVVGSRSDAAERDALLLGDVGQYRCRLRGTTWRDVKGIDFRVERFFGILDKCRRLILRYEKTLPIFWHELKAVAKSRMSETTPRMKVAWCKTP